MEAMSALVVIVPQSLSAGPLLGPEALSAGRWR
jgi:hypothetical protein